MKIDISILEEIALGLDSRNLISSAEYLRQVHAYVTLLENALNNSKNVLELTGNHNDAVAYIDFLLTHSGKRNS